MYEIKPSAESAAWTEAETSTPILVEAESGGLLKWWSNRDTVLRVLIDETDVGALSGWKGRLETPVEPGQHSVRIRQGPFMPSSHVMVEVKRGGITTIMCGRNIFTGGVSFIRKE